MSKRFIDTDIFEDDWFMDLSKDGKLMWLYVITRCDHAGIFKLNERLCKFHLGINDPLTVIELLGNRIIRVRELLYFIPKFITFQYPKFPNSKVKQQESAISILTNYGLWDGEKINSSLIVNEVLGNSYDNDSGNDNGIVYSNFYDSEILKSENNPEYIKFVKFIFGENGVERPFNKLLNMKDQIGYKQFIELKRISEENNTKILDTVRRLENYNKKTYVSFYLTLCNWLKPNNNVR